MPEIDRPPYPDSLLKLPVNTAGRDWFVGDLHGELRLLERIFEGVGFDTGKDRLICTGDLVDRGPDSIDMLRLFAEAPGWFFSVLGNHDAMMRESLVRGSRQAERVWRHNGGGWAYELPPAQRSELARALMRMPLAIEAPMADGRRIGVVHADLPSWRAWSEIAQIEPDAEDAVDASFSDPNHLLWSRRRIKHAMAMRDYPTARDIPPEVRLKTLKMLTPAIGIDLLIMGHTVLQPAVPLRAQNFLWIDTGAGYPGGRLTAVDPLRGECVQAAAGKGIRRFALPEPVRFNDWQLSWDEIPMTLHGTLHGTRRQRLLRAAPVNQFGALP